MEWATLAGPVESELLIKKSRFLGRVMPVSGRAEAYAEVARLKALHPGAVHVCWALLAGGQSAAVDDGEPSGTAGRPMLDVLRHQQLEGVLRRELAAREGVLLDVAHAADVSVQLQLPEPQAEAFRAWLDDAGHGRVQWFEPEKADEA